MRLIRTELYFSPDAVKWTAKATYRDNPGVSIAWIPYPDPNKFSTDTLIALLSDDHPKRVVKGSDKLLEIFLDLAIQGVQGSEADEAIKKQDWPIANWPLIKYLLDETNIVYEGSPPKPLKVSEARLMSLSLILGTFIATQGSKALETFGFQHTLFLTLPLGFLVMTGTLATGLGILRGWPSAIENALKGGGQKPSPESKPPTA
jgi:hypothetical protein